MVLRLSLNREPRLLTKLSDDPGSISSDDAYNTPDNIVRNETIKNERDNK